MKMFIRYFEEENVINDWAVQSKNSLEGRLYKCHFVKKKIK